MQARQVAVDPAEQLHVHEQLIHRRVADALTDAEGAGVRRDAHRPRAPRARWSRRARGPGVRASRPGSAGRGRRRGAQTKRTRLRTPSGVAWPTVSQTQTRPAPARIAVVYMRRMWSGCARVVSSVTYMTGRPSLTASATASSERRSIRSKSQSSAYWRIGEEPMKQDTSIGMPTFCEISMIGRMSASTVRAAQLGRIFSLLPDDLLRQARDRFDDVRSGAGKADVRRVDAERLHQVEDADLLLDRGALDGGRLQAVAQRLVVELDTAAGRETRRRPARFQS